MDDIEAKTLAERISTETNWQGQAAEYEDWPDHFYVLVRSEEEEDLVDSISTESHAENFIEQWKIDPNVLPYNC